MPSSVLALKKISSKLMDTENKLMIDRPEEMRELGEQGERIEKYKLQLRNSHRNVKYNLGNKTITLQ